MILLLLWSTLYIAFLKYKVSQIFTTDFTLSLPTQISWVKLSRNSRCFEKEAAILCLLYVGLYVAFSKSKLSWILFLDFSLALLLQFQRSSDIAPFLEHPIYSIFKFKNIPIIILSRFISRRNLLKATCHSFPQIS